MGRNTVMCQKAKIVIIDLTFRFFDGICTVIAVYVRNPISNTFNMDREKLQVASYIGHKAIVDLLLEKGADVNAQGGYYMVGHTGQNC
jgi:hypothetical protein